MSDWEDDSEDGCGIQKLAKQSAPPEWKLPSADRQSENVFFGVKPAAKFGLRREFRADRSGEESQFKYRTGEGREGPRSTGRRNFGHDSSDSTQPVTFTVENASIGRVIGRFFK